MRGEIVRAEVGFHFHNPADAFHAAGYVHQIFPKQFSGNYNRVSIIKCTR